MNNLNAATRFQCAIYQIADAVIEAIGNRQCPFDKITIVFHNVKIAQWFKSYYLKKQKDQILMNVEYLTLSSFINNTINIDGSHILTASQYREYIIKALLSSDCKTEEFSYFNTPTGLNGINLYEFADKLSTIIFNMEFDDEEITNSWQAEIYNLANKYAVEDGYYTPKQLFVKNENNLVQPEGNVYVVDNSYISTLYYKVLEKFDNVTVFSLDDEPVEINNYNIELYSAPSKMREIERLHSDICRKLENEKDTLVNDFVVYAPNINDYADIIHRVFQRSAPGFPEIPFRIVGESREKHEIISALDLMFKIANKGFFTRYDLQKYLKNTMVMYKWDIDNDDIDAFMESVESTNTHRNGDGNDDWDYLTKRLLSSVLSDGLTSFENDKYLTYSSISMNTNRINKLIDIVNALSDWAALFTGDLSSKMLSKDNIIEITEKMNMLFSVENQYGEEKNYLYLDVRKEAEKVSCIFDEIPAITFLLLLKDAPNRYSSGSADIFMSGVTFMRLGNDNVVSEKYVYILGLSSKDFPRVENRNEIDYSQKHVYASDLDKKTFINLLKNSVKLIISYQNRDLQTDEEFFPSTVIPKDINKIDISLDENRDMDELYTYRSLLSKMRISNIGQENIKPETPALVIADKPVISTSQIKKYLDNTIIYKYSQTLRISDDEDTAKADEYENIDLGGIKEYSVIREMIMAATTPDKSGNVPDWNSVKTDILNKFKLEKKLPNNLEENYFDSLYIQYAKSIIDEINSGYKKIEQFTIDLKECIVEMNSVCFCREQGLDIFFIEPRHFSEKANPKYYLLPYACALAYVANKNDDNEYNITLKSKEDVTFPVTPLKAKEVLLDLADQMKKLNDIKYMDIKLYTDISNEYKVNGSRGTISEYESIPKTVDKLVSCIEWHDSWVYFRDKVILNPDIDFGYDSTSDSIMLAVFKEFIKIRDVILY